MRTTKDETSNTKLGFCVAACGALVFLCALARSVRADDGRKGLYVVVTREAFVDAARELAEYRRARDCRVVVGVWEQFAVDRDAPPRADEIKAWIDRTVRAQGPPVAAIVLCGDETPSLDGKAPWRMPAFRQPLYRWRPKQRKTFTSDAVYGDLDGDALPEVPVGRLPVRTADELRAYLARLRRYEVMPLDAPALRTVLWIGIPGYDRRSDAFMTPVALQTVRRYLPPELTAWWLSGDPHWPCWLPPDEQPRRFLAEVAAGSVFTLFGGHGSAYRASANVSKTMRTTMTIDDLKHLAADRPAAPMIFLACTIGRVEWSEGRCLAEALWHHPGGPVAVVAASTESHPLTNYYSAVALAKTIGERPPTVGQWWVRSQRVGFVEHVPVMEAMLKDAEGKLEDPIDVVKLRRDQPLMFGLLGDPLCRLRLPARLDVAAERSGDRVVVRADLPAGVRTVSLDVLPPLPPPATTRAAATSAPSQEERSARRRSLERFNASRIAVCAMAAKPGPFEVSRLLPREVGDDGGTIRVRLAAFGDGGRSWAGVAEIAAGKQEAATR